jgi:bifunctional DNA-binding transcriptional regulator/antitoxin component of YhaV-PrlF toxin-antitoxin module
MRTVVKMDEKGRIQLPTAVRKKMKLRPRQAVVLKSMMIRSS